MKTAAKLALLCVMIALALGSVWEAAATIRRRDEQIPAEIWAPYQAKSARAQYLLREEDGHVAVYRSGERSPERLTDIETPLLRRSDRAMLSRGIPAEDIAELLSLLEDLGS